MKDTDLWKIVRTALLMIVDGIERIILDMRPRTSELRRIAKGKDDG